MRLNLLVLILTSFCLYACDGLVNSSRSIESKTGGIAPMLITDSTSYVFAVRDIGKLKQGEIVSIKFAIENGFERAMVIKSVQSTCGCVSVNYNPQPIKKGERMVFDLTYNSQNRFGTQFANVIISSNFGDYIYRIEVFVEK